MDEVPVLNPYSNPLLTLSRKCRFLVKTRDSLSVSEAFNDEPTVMDPNNQSAQSTHTSEVEPWYRRSVHTWFQSSDSERGESQRTSPVVQSRIKEDITYLTPCLIRRYYFWGYCIRFCSLFKWNERGLSGLPRDRSRPSIKTKHSSRSLFVQPRRSELSVEDTDPDSTDGVNRGKRSVTLRPFSLRSFSSKEYFYTRSPSYVGKKNIG